MGRLSRVGAFLWGRVYRYIRKKILTRPGRSQYPGDSELTQFGLDTCFIHVSGPDTAGKVYFSIKSLLIQEYKKTDDTVRWESTGESMHGSS